jgi:hypothetical protein
MDSNTYSTHPVDELAVLTAAVDQFGTRQRHGLPDAVRAERVQQLRRLVDRMEGFWLQDLADLDACGAAGAEDGIQAPSTASWLRNRLNMGAGVAHSSVRTARHDRTEQRHGRRGLWLSPTFEGMVALEGRLDPEAGQTLLAALEPLARPATADDERSGSQRRADALTELARRNLEGGRLPQTGGVRPQLLVTVDLDSLLGRPGAVGGDGGWTGPLDPETCRRLACDGAITRVMVTRHPNQHGPERTGHDHGHCGNHELQVADRVDLAAQLRHAMTLLPLTLGGTPTQPLDLGRTTRVVHPAQRGALVERDGGCVPGM